jgi:hypothetical protein
MQFNPVYLYSNKLDVFTNPLDSWTTERYRRVYNRNLKIYRSVDNRIDVQVRNSDQKASNITGSTLVFNLVTRETKDLVFQKDFSAMDLVTGKVTVILTEYEMLDIDPGFYEYSIVKEVRESIDSTDYKVTSRIAMYMDSQYDTLGTIEVLGDVLGEVTPSVAIDKFEYVNPFTTGGEDSKFFISSIVDTKPTFNSAGTLHTFQFYSSNYRGTVTIQGSLDEQGATPHKWVDISTVDLTTQRYKNITGKYNWFRIKHVPTQSSSTATFTIAQTMLLDYNVDVGNAGKGYEIGNTILIPGNRLGGELGTNDLTITVSAIDGIGGITGVTWTGLSYNGVQTFVLADTNIVVGSLDKVLYR